MILPNLHGETVKVLPWSTTQSLSVVPVVPACYNYHDFASREQHAERAVGIHLLPSQSQGETLQQYQCDPRPRQLCQQLALALNRLPIDVASDLVDAITSCRLRAGLEAQIECMCLTTISPTS